MQQYPYPYVAQNPYQPVMPSQAVQPYQQPMRQQGEQPVHGFVYVQGIEGARAYYLPNGSEMPLFDNDTNVLYMKRVDQSGRMTIDVVDCTPHVEPSQAEYATVDDVRALHREIDQLRGALMARTERSGDEHLPEAPAA